MSSPASELHPLPQSWSWSTVDEIIHADAPVVYGILQPGPDTPNGVPYVRPTEIVEDQIQTNKLRRTTPSIAAEYTRSQLRPGDVLISIVGTIGKIAIVPAELDGANITQSSARIRPDSRILAPDFLASLLRAPILRQQYEKLMLGTGVPRLNIAHVRALALPIPPLNEQHRITAKLESLLARSRRAKEALDAIPALLERFRQSVLAAAFRGDLTADWRAQHPDVEPASKLLETINSSNNNAQKKSKLAREATPIDTTHPPSWARTTLGVLARVLDPNPSHRYPAYEGGEVPLLSTREFSGLNDWDVSSAPLIPQNVFIEQNARCEYSINDIIMARKGRLGLARRPPPLERYAFSHTIFVIKPSPLISSEFLLWSLRPSRVTEWLGREMNSNTGVPTLGKAITEQLPINLPPVEEQRLISERIKALFSAAEAIETKLASVIVRKEQLDRSLLTKAFRGELVPQDPNDEPASVLLERLRAEREASDGSTPKRSRGRRPAA
jgi:type I restriction enzyme S subunit